MSRTLAHAVLAFVLCSAATSYAQQPPQPVCNHQWVPNGGPVLGSPTNPPCGQAATPPHTAFQVDASEFYRGYVDSYQGQQTQCTLDTVMLTLPGECGGTNQGQPVTCMPEVPGYSSSSVSDAVTTTFSYEVFVETGSTGSISCKYSDTVKDNTPTLSASTPDCGCPCPSSAPGPTFAAGPYTVGDQYNIYSPTGWTYYPGTSTYNSSDDAVATIDNPPSGSGDTPAAVIESNGTTNISGLNLVFTANSGGYIATGCSTGAAALTVAGGGGGSCQHLCGSICMDNMTCPGPGGGTPTCEDTEGGWIPVCPPPEGSPILVDAFGQGFHLTGIVGGVSFTFFPNKPAVQISWTDPNFSNGWLALDRNGNGRIDNATELFGNLTPQPPSATPNGYLALAMFDQPANGGNGNGAIDPGDQVFSKLLVWIDSNHDGISQPGELHSLRDVGIYGIGLAYKNEPYVDRFGNKFRYQGQIFDDADIGHYRTYDVFLRYTSK
jgi:hypothetical protein